MLTVPGTWYLYNLHNQTQSLNFGITSFSTVTPIWLVRYRYLTLFSFTDFSISWDILLPGIADFLHIWELAECLQKRRQFRTFPLVLTLHIQQGSLLYLSRAHGNPTLVQKK